ncbi:uncharacterized protein LOC129321384 isoform X2 [Prosopis cineraria]|uniref:uncharacterized protein LOC129321384 isoform X2 n=1 Tax=Prosopis cineraria TaxID=364024 RepID=UPI0024100B58|nr:uncharacterized protein LOC129321384 isoform X2 [Prosopis cineraria]
MMTNSSVRCASPLHHHSLSSRSSLAFFNRFISTKSILSGETRNLRLVTVRSQTSGSDHGSPAQRSVGFTESPPSVGIPNSSSSLIDFLTLCRRLKTTKRKGWVNHGIRGAESIADHMYRMAIMALIAADLPGLNRERCIKLALVHDIAEEKSRREQAALNEMCEILGGGMRAEEIKELWAEYEHNSSLEANLVKDFDKVEMILQALEYEIEHGKVLDEFFISTAGKFQTEIGKSWAAEIFFRRKSISAQRLR